MSNTGDQFLRQQQEIQAAQALARAEAEIKWKASIVEEDEKLKDTHTRKEYTFTQTEARQLLTVATIQALSREIEKFSQTLIQDMLNNIVLPRIQVQPSPDKKVLFEPTLGRMAMWLPKKMKIELPTEQKTK